MIDRTGVSLYLQNAGSAQATKKKALGKDDFMKLLIAQLKNQSPAQPMDNRQFISQMATFSTLEQMTNMNSELGQFLQYQTVNAQLANAQLIGKQVTWQNSESYGGGTDTGIIQAVSFQNGQVWFETQDGTKIQKGQIMKIGLPSESEGGA